MIYKDGRGENKKHVATENREIVRKWFKKNKNTTIKECCEGVGMTYKTVRGHIDAIQRGE